MVPGRPAIGGDLHDGHQSARIGGCPGDGDIPARKSGAIGRIGDRGGGRCYIQRTARDQSGLQRVRLGTHV